MEALQSLPPVVALVLGFIGLVWLVLVFLVPFMIEGIRQSTRKTHEELAEMNARLDRLNALLARRGAPAAHGDAPDFGPAAHGRGKFADDAPEPRRRREPADAGTEPRKRREPTISETEVRPSGQRNRREPIVR